MLSNLHTFLICRVRMGQFHFEPTENGFSKSPDWSLGNYSRTVVIRHNGDYLNDSAPIIKVSYTHIHTYIYAYMQLYTELTYLHTHIHTYYMQHDTELTYIHTT